LEEGGKDEREAIQVFREVDANPDWARRVRLGSYDLAAKGTDRGLEAADCFAWHWTKCAAESLYTQERKPREDLKALVLDTPHKYRVQKIDGRNLERFIRVRGSPQQA
jgi:hypothetical protein